MQLSGNTVLITGGSSGIGLALTERFLKAGNQVLITGRRENLLEDVRRRFPSVITVVSDSGSKRSGSPTTASMQVYGLAAAPDGSTRAGLVLLYAPSYEQFAPAYLLHDRDLIIGRDPASGICVPEAAVSRRAMADRMRVLTSLGAVS